MRNPLCTAIGLESGTMIYLDSHVLVWLYAGRTELFSSEGKVALEQHDLVISPMVRLELEFLFEIDRISVCADEILQDLYVSIGVRVCDLPFDSIVSYGLKENWTRDPFDRLIVAQAKAKGQALLLTKDGCTRQHYAGALW